MKRLRLVRRVQPCGGLRGVVPDVLDVAHQVALQYSVAAEVVSPCFGSSFFVDWYGVVGRTSPVTPVTFLLLDTALPKKLPMIQ